MYSLAISYLHKMHFDNMHPLLAYTHSCETPPQHILLLFRSFILCHLLSLSKVTCTQAWGVSTMFSCTSTAWILFIEFMIKIGELIFVLVQIFRSDIELNHLKTPFTTSGWWPLTITNLCTVPPRCGPPVQADCCPRGPSHRHHWSPGSFHRCLPSQRHTCPAGCGSRLYMIFLTHG